MMPMDFSAGLMRLVLDPQFAAFERLAKRPNFFRIVGRTHTETWHSMLLGWLLDPKGSHGLGGFALQRLLLAAADGSSFAPEGGRAVAMNVAVFGEFGEAVVTPNERNPKEMQIKVGDRGGRLDVFVSGIRVSGKNDREAVLALEQKVFAVAETEQCNLYSAWLDAEHAGKIHIRILLAPVIDPEERLVDDDGWFVLDYQSLHDDVLVPALEHPDLDDVVRPLIEQYVDALRIPMNGTKLAVSQEEKDLANDLYKRHQTTFEALFEVLAEAKDNPQLQALVEASRNAEKQPILLKVGGKTITGTSGSDLFKNTALFLDKLGKLAPLVPFSTGTKRYLVAEEPKHPAGNDFISPAQVTGRTGTTYHIEANVSRQNAVKYALKLLAKAGCEATVVNA